MSEIKDHKVYTFIDPDTVLFATNARFVRETDYLSVIKEYRDALVQLQFEKARSNDALLECGDICDRVKHSSNYVGILDAFSFGLNKLVQILTRKQA